MSGGSRIRSPLTPVPARAGAGSVFARLVAVWAVVTALVLLGPTPRAASVAAGSGRPSVISYADGAPPGFSGAAGEDTCHACHFEAEPNAPPGTLAVEGVPERAIAGQRYPLTITLTRPAMALGGFQLSARFEDGSQAGTLAPADGEAERIKIEEQGTVAYANQRRAGAIPQAPGTITWTLVWTAPDAPAPVRFSAAANAADNDESVRGDYVYTATAATR